MDRAEIEYLNVVRSDASHQHAFARLGAIYFDQGRSGRALPFLARAKELDLNDLETRIKLALLFLGNGVPQAAAPEALAVLQHRPDDPNAPVLLADSARSPKEIADVKGHFDALPGPMQHRAPVLVAKAILELRLGRVAVAQDLVDQALATDPKLVAAHSFAGLLAAAQKDLPKAERSFARAAELSAIRSPQRLQFANFKFQQGDIAGAEKLLEDMIQSAPDYLPAQIRLVEIAARENRFDVASALLKGVLARDGAHSEALLMSVRLALAKKESPAASTEVQKLLRLFPQAPEAHYESARVQLLQRNPTGALTSLVQAVRLKPDYTEAILVLASLQLQVGKAADAISTLKPLVEKRSDLPDALLILAEAHGTLGDYALAMSLCDRLLTVQPGNERGLLLQANLFLRQKRPDEARRVFSGIIARNPGSIPAVEQMIALELAAKRPQAAEALLGAALKSNPLSAEFLVMASRLAVANGKSDEIEPNLRKAIEVQPDYLAAYLLLARRYVEGGDTVRALANLNAVSTRNPSDVSALMLTGIIHEQRGERPAARAAYEKLLAVDANFSPALNNLAYLYAEHFNEPAKAYELARRARDRSPQDPYTADTLGWILYRRGELEWAVGLLRESAGKLPGAAEVHYHLGMALYTRGETEPAAASLSTALKLNAGFPGADEAKQCLAILGIPTDGGDGSLSLLESRLKTHPKDSVAWMKLAEIHEAAKRTDKALQALQEAVKVNDQNVAAAVRLAALQFGSNDLDGAFRLARDVRKIAPDNVEAAIIIGRVALKKADFLTAFNLLDDAAHKLPTDASLAFDAGQAALAMGKVEEARRAFRRCLELGSMGSVPASAQVALTFLDSVNKPATEATIALARKTLEREPNDLPALYYLASSSRTSGDNVAAINFLERILNSFPKFDPAKRLLALILVAGGKDYARALQLGTEARETYSGDSELARSLGIASYRQNDFRRAVALLQSATKDYPRDAVLFHHLGLAQLKDKQVTAGRSALQQALEMGLSGDSAVEARQALGSSGP